MIIQRFIEGMLEANCFVVSSDGQCFVIDPGYSPKKIIKYIRKEGLECIGIIATHHHYDHTAAVRQIRNEFDCPLYMHRADCDIYGKHVDVILEDGDVLNFGTEKLVVLHTPGHTEGGICLMNQRAKTCFTGDTIFNVDLGRTDLEDGSETQMADSIRNVCATWPHDLTIYPGHGDPCTMKYVYGHNKEFNDIIG